MKVVAVLLLLSLSPALRGAEYRPTLPPISDSRLAGQVNGRKLSEIDTTSFQQLAMFYRLRLGLAPLYTFPDSDEEIFSNRIANSKLDPELAAAAAHAIALKAPLAVLLKDTNQPIEVRMFAAFVRCSHLWQEPNVEVDRDMLLNMLEPLHQTEQSLHFLAYLSHLAALVGRHFQRPLFDSPLENNRYLQSLSPYLFTLAERGTRELSPPEKQRVIEDILLSITHADLFNYGLDAFIFLKSLIKGNHPRLRGERVKLLAFEGLIHWASEWEPRWKDYGSDTAELNFRKITLGSGERAHVMGWLCTAIQEEPSIPIRLQLAAALDNRRTDFWTQLFLLADRGRELEELSRAQARKSERQPFLNRCAAMVAAGWKRFREFTQR